MDTPQGPAPTPPALVGRERELLILREALAAACAGRGSLVLVGGEAGIGKTALAEALLAEAATQGALVLVGRCYDLSETPPYGPWVEALDRAPVGDDLPALPAAVLPAAHDDGAPLASQDAILRRVRDYLAALAARRPLVLLLDDLHWADPASLDLLRVVARDLRALPVLLLATYRADEIGADHPLAVLLPLLVREAHAARLDLRPLDPDAIAALVAARYALDEGAQARLVGYLAARTEGNALFLGELLRTLEGAGLLREERVGWVVGDLAATPVPALLRQVIAARVARLTPETARLLAAAAVVGQEVPLALWAAVGDVAEAVLLDHLEWAGAARLLAEMPDGAGVRFPHALIREALYAGTPPARRRAWHRRVAEALAAAPAADPDAVAYHFRQAGDARAVAWLVRAGERARHAYAWATAVERFEQALALADRAGTGAEERGLLLYRLARLRRYAAPHQALADLDAVARLADAAGDRALAALALFCRGLTRIALRETPEGLPELAAGVAALHALTAEERARLDGYEGRRTWPNAHGTLVVKLAWAGRYAAALAAAARGALDEPPASATGSGVGGSFLADLQHGLGLAHAALGRPEEADRAFARARALYRDVEHHLLLGRVAVEEQLLVALPYRAEQLAARRQLAAAGEVAWRRASGLLAASFAPRLAALPLLLVEGAWAEARALGHAVLADPIRDGEEPSAVLLGELAHAQGDPGLAWTRVRPFFPAGPATEPTWQPAHLAQRGQRLAALLALDVGDLPRAGSWLAAHDRWLAWSGAVLGQAEGQLGWAAYHRAAGDLLAARARAETALARATEPRWD